MLLFYKLTEAPYWKDKEKAALLKMLMRKPNFNKAKNIIFFLGDGNLSSILKYLPIFKSADLCLMVIFFFLIQACR